MAPSRKYTEQIHDYIKKFISSVPLCYNSYITAHDHTFFVKKIVSKLNGIELTSDFLFMKTVVLCHIMNSYIITFTQCISDAVQ